MDKKGLFITFEGIDGSGKSVQAERLLRALEAGNFPVRLVRDPGSASISESIRSILLSPLHNSMAPVTELFLYEAARSQLVEEYIRPFLEQGGIVVSDRFTDSTLAYQGYGRGLPLDLIREANRWACGPIHPDRTYILDIDWKESLRRRTAEKLNADRMESEKQDFYNRVRTGYHNLFRDEPERIRLLDGLRPMDFLEQEILSDVLYYIESQKISF